MMELIYGEKSAVDIIRRIETPPGDLDPLDADESDFDDEDDEELPFAPDDEDDEEDSEKRF